MSSQPMVDSANVISTDATTRRGGFVHNHLVRYFSLDQSGGPTDWPKVKK